MHQPLGKSDIIQSVTPQAVKIMLGSNSFISEIFTIVEFPPKILQNDWKIDLKSWIRENIQMIGEQTLALQ